MLSAMTPRSLYRWKSFWFGVLVLVFLSWSWVRSMVAGDYIPINGSLEEVARIDQSGGRIAVGWVLENPVFSLPEIPLAMQFQQGELPWFPAAVKYWSPVDGWGAVGVAHWFLIVLFLAAWAGCLAWRRRRMRKFFFPPGDAAKD